MESYRSLWACLLRSQLILHHRALLVLLQAAGLHHRVVHRAAAGRVRPAAGRPVHLVQVLRPGLRAHRAGHPALLVHRRAVVHRLQAHAVLVHRVLRAGHPARAVHRHRAVGQAAVRQVAVLLNKRRILWQR